MNKNNSILSIISIAILFGLIAYGSIQMKRPLVIQKVAPIVTGDTPLQPSQPRNSIETDGDTVVCTMDAKLCPDGSSVGRRGPRCEFAPCPGN